MSEFIRVARASEIPPGTMRRVGVAGRAVALVNLGGEFYAIDDRCTHEESSLSAGTLSGEVVACPKHGARFDVKTGRVLSLPAVRSVDTYPVRVEGDDVLVSPEARKATGLPHRR
jgi:3-phenylpropionate/trans-cinnamate dioxygenase ferredoxin component